MIKKDTLSFIAELRENNEKNWFEANKPRYLMAKENMEQFVQAIQGKMNTHDMIEEAKLYRIYRDVRFSKDKTPYKDHMDVGLSRQKPQLRGGYYLRISPGNSMIAGGFWNPAASDLELIRRHIEFDGDRLKKILGSKKLVDTFGNLQGDELKTAPKGFEKDHPHIDLLRKKQFVYFKPLTDQEVLRPNFVAECSQNFQALRPWYDYMSEILGYNLNGEPLY